jgi:hypothetical protein
MSPSHVSSVSLAIFLLILPTFSSSSCLTKLPCDSTIEIRPPFFVGTPGLDPACRKSINVSCGDLGPELGLVTPSKLLLKEISYGTGTIRVQDVELSILKNLSCGLMFSFTPPVSDFLSSYLDLERWFSLINCGDSNQTLFQFQSMFGDDKAVHQSTEPDDGHSLVASCHASPQFEWMLSFSVGGGQIPQVNFSVPSASIRNFLSSPSDCISPSPGGNI